jgi:hypothetical protein
MEKEKFKHIWSKLTKKYGDNIEVYLAGENIRSSNKLTGESMMLLKDQHEKKSINNIVKIFSTMFE